MAQSGYTPILIYGSGTASAVPINTNLTSSANGAELALNYADGKLYYKDSGGTVQLLASKATAALAIPITVANGGTGLSTTTAYGLIAAGTTSTGNFQQVSGTGTSGQVLTSNGAGALPTWQAGASGNVTTSGNNAFTGANTFYNATGQAFAPATTNDGIIIQGRAGGSSTYRVTFATATLSGNRTLTFPDATDTAAVLGTAQTFTAAQTFRAANAIRSEAASTQDAVVIAGRAGGTSSRAVTITPTTLNASRTITLPDADINFTTGLGVAQGGTGAATLTANNVILGNGTSAVQFVAPSTAGNALLSNGTTWISSAIPASGFSDMAVFTTSGTWTVPAGVTKCRVIVVGGGGGGGTNGAGLGSAGGTGGGAGGVAIKTITGLTPGSSITVTVGSGGGSATAGGTSSFSTYCSATGGSAGVTGTASITAPSGGAGSGGDLNLTGGSGGIGTWDSSGLTWQLAGFGGTNMFGGAGVGGSYYSSNLRNGAAATANTGAGGGGRAGSAGSGYSGGSGLVLVYY